jgi:hypothetical protein
MLLLIWNRHDELYFGPKTLELMKAVSIHGFGSWMRIKEVMKTIRTPASLREKWTRLHTRPEWAEYLPKELMQPQDPPESIMANEESSADDEDEDDEDFQTTTESIAVTRARRTGKGTPATETGPKQHAQSQEQRNQPPGKSRAPSSSSSRRVSAIASASPATGRAVDVEETTQQVDVNTHKGLNYGIEVFDDHASAMFDNHHDDQSLLGLGFQSPYTHPPPTATTTTPNGFFQSAHINPSAMFAQVYAPHTSSEPIPASSSEHRVSQWLHQLGMSEYWQLLENDGWTDADVLKQVLQSERAEEILKAIGVAKGGHRMKMILAVDKL